MNRTNVYASHWKETSQYPTGFLPASRRFLRHCVLSFCAAADRSIGQTFLRCLYCHYVFDDQRRDFQRLLERLMTIGAFVDTDRAMRLLKGEEPIDRRYFHLSFDDGFRNTYTNAAPILKALRVPAIVFVPSLMIRSTDEPERAHTNIVGRRSSIEMLRWDDLEAMRADDWLVGSHTRTHARLSAISHDEAALEDQIVRSKIELEERLGTECRYFSWPYGRVSDVDERSLRVVKRAGYHACFGAFRGTVVPGQTDMFRIPRHHFEPQWPLAHIEYFARGNMESRNESGRTLGIGGMRSWLIR